MIVMGNNKEEAVMAGLKLMEQHSLNEQSAKKILSTSTVKLPKSNEFNDIYLSDEEAISHAAEIIKSRKK